MSPTKLQTLYFMYEPRGHGHLRTGHLGVGEKALLRHTKPVSPRPVVALELGSSFGKVL